MMDYKQMQFSIRRRRMETADLTERVYMDAEGRLHPMTRFDYVLDIGYKVGCGLSSGALLVLAFLVVMI